MATRWIEQLKQQVRPLIFRLVFPRRPRFDCPICGYHGPFKDKRSNYVPGLRRVNDKCLGCGAAVRHRVLSLVLDEVLNKAQATQIVLHVAPEACLQRKLAAAFGTYHTMDLNRKDADFREDLQALSFADGSYDCVVSSRVLHLPADFTACVREMRRVLRPNGMAIISENYARETTIEYDDVNLGRRVRGIGLNAIQIYREVFGRVDLYWSDRYDQRYQLVNTMVLNGLAKDDYPDAVRVPNVGYKDVVAVCHALPQDR